MTTAEFFAALQAELETLAIGPMPVFEKAELWDSDQPDKQIEALQKSKGRFAIIFHDGTDFRVEQHGRNQTAQKVVAGAILFSNRSWKSEEPPSAGVDVFSTIDALAQMLRGRVLARPPLNPARWIVSARKVRRGKPPAGSSTGFLSPPFGATAPR